MARGRRDRHPHHDHRRAGTTQDWVLPAFLLSVGTIADFKTIPRRATRKRVLATRKWPNGMHQRRRS
jgi:hypothetical protein